MVELTSPVCLQNGQLVRNYLQTEYISQIMVKEREPLEQAKVVIGSGYTSWDEFSEDERESSFRVGLENLEKVDWVPPEYQDHLEEAKSVLRNGMARGLAEYERKSALFVAMEELEKIDWAPPSDD